MYYKTPGDDTLHAQQTSLYLLDKVDNPNPRKLFICDLVKLIEDAMKADQDIILMGGFKKKIGKDAKMMARVLQVGRLTDVHANKHGNHIKIITYIRRRRRVDYCFVLLRLLDCVLC